MNYAAMPTKAAATPAKVPRAPRTSFKPVTLGDVS